MFDLIYPEEIAPVTPPVNYENRTVITGCEFFPLVEESGMVVGRALRSYCHSGVKVLHPVVHLHILDRFGRLYLQKRSSHKDIQPGKWDTAVGGHISYGECVLEALYREASEELHMTCFNPVAVCHYVFESEIEREMVNVFATVGNFSPEPDLDEVECGRFWEMKEIQESLGLSVFTPNFEQEFVRIKDKLTALL